MDEQREKRSVRSFMNLHFTARCFAAIGIGLVALPIVIFAAESASDLAAGLRAKQEGSTFVRVRMKLCS